MSLTHYLKKRAGNWLAQFSSGCTPGIKSFRHRPLNHAPGKILVDLLVLCSDTLCIVLGILPRHGGDRILTNTVRYAHNIKDFGPLELISSATRKDQA